MRTKIPTADTKDLKAIVSILDPEHYARVEQLWEELEDRFGLKHPFLTPIPHFTYHVAEDYDAEALEHRLASLTRHRRPFTVRTSGLGLFTDTTPVLYIPIVRTSALTVFHQQLHTLLRPVTHASLDLYAPYYWTPHITLATRNLQCKQLGNMVSYLSERQFTWQITIDNVALICESCDGTLDVQTRYALTGQEPSI
jgi:2'-5' RNA ligase